jgi:hypothetical protein
LDASSSQGSVGVDRTDRNDSVLTLDARKCVGRNDGTSESQVSDGRTCEGDAQERGDALLRLSLESSIAELDGGSCRGEGSDGSFECRESLGSSEGLGRRSEEEGSREPHVGRWWRVEETKASEAAGVPKHTGVGSGVVSANP